MDAYQRPKFGSCNGELLGQGLIPVGERNVPVRLLQHLLLLCLVRLLLLLLLLPLLW